MNFLDKFRLLLLTFPLDADRYGGNLYSNISYLLQGLPVYNCSPSLPGFRARLFLSDYPGDRKPRVNIQLILFPKTRFVRIEESYAKNLKFLLQVPLCRI